MKLLNLSRLEFKRAKAELGFSFVCLVCFVVAPLLEVMARRAEEKRMDYHETHEAHEIGTGNGFFTTDAE